MRKALNWLGGILFGIAFIAAIYFVIPKDNTCDLRGYIEEIQIDEKNDCTWITISEITNEHSHIKLKISANVSIKNYGGEKISVNQIKIGQLLDADIKGSKVDDTYYQAKWIRIIVY